MRSRQGSEVQASRATLPRGARGGPVLPLPASGAAGGPSHLCICLRVASPLCASLSPNSPPTEEGHEPYWIMLHTISG